jgi:lipoprotein-anchoring transpeptidase ErfK/SrfK
MVGALFVLAAAAYAIDRANVDKIADGVRVGGVNVGGLSADDARHRLRTRLAKPIDNPVTVTLEGERHVLSPDRLQLRANVDGMVDEALAASRSGGFPARVWRYATGGSVDREVAPQISYSAQALDGFVDEIAERANRAPRDATVAPTPSSLDTVPAQDGLTLRDGDLKRQLRAAIDSPRHRTVPAPVKRLEPQVTTDELADTYPVFLTVDRAAFRLRLWKDLKLARTYTIAVGQAGLETPAGQYTIDDKQVNPSWHVPDSDWAGELAGEVIPPGPRNPLKARWMGFYAGAGIHGTEDLASLGTAASHGCIRMSIPDVVSLYDQVPPGTPIYVGN